MCETVGQFFQSIFVARDIREGAEWRNELTKERVACGQTRDRDDDVRIASAALRIVTERGWVRV